MPDDEYKEKKILYFLAEAAVLVFLIQLILVVLNEYVHAVNIDSFIGVGVGLAIFVFYVFGRYIFSGIEYTDVVTHKSYAKELKLILFKSLSFPVIFLITYVIIIELPKTTAKWIELLGLLVTVAVVHFLFGFISLKRSYRKNKEILDDE